MIKIYNHLKIPLKLSIVSLLISIFLHTSSNPCGSHRFGLPLRFIRTHCDCSEHLFPIDIMNLGIDMTYHMVVWSIMIYLWKDTKETWQLLQQSFIDNKSS